MACSEGLPPMWPEALTLPLLREPRNAIGLENIIAAQYPNGMSGIATRNDR